MKNLERSGALQKVNDASMGERSSLENVNVADFHTICMK